MYALLTVWEMVFAAILILVQMFCLSLARTFEDL